MPNPMISAIVPVYNVAPYLQQCLDSLIGQTFENIEIICVDDGSSDDSANILADYAQKDSRIRVISQPNQGVSVARNTGINEARGKYISFVDGDDYLAPFAYEELWGSIGEETPDIVLFRHTAVLNDKLIESKPFQNGRLIIEEADFSFLVDKFVSVVWSKLYLKDFLKKNKLNFSHGVPIGEDSLFNLTCFALKPTLKQVDKSFYFYRRQRQGAATFGPMDVKKAVLLQEALEQAPFYAKLSAKDQLVTDMFMLAFYHKSCDNCEVVDTPTLDVITSYVNTLKSRYSLKQLNQYKHFRKILYIVEHNGQTKEFISLAEHLFSIKNSSDKQYKIVRFLGVKFKLKRHKKNSTFGESRAC